MTLPLPFLQPWLSTTVIRDHTSYVEPGWRRTLGQVTSYPDVIVYNINIVIKRCILKYH